MTEDKVLVTGAGGQLGSVLTEHLSKRYGISNVILSDIHKIPQHENTFENLDITDRAKMGDIISKHNISIIYHLAAILSANGEKNPILAKKVNSDGFLNVLESAKEYGVTSIFYPSSIAVFGYEVPSTAPQYTTLIPKTVYGITKVEGENWSQYYYDNYGIDIRSVRFPGVIGYQSMPGGGTTDYAVDIFYSALRGETFSCFLEPDVHLPMIYMYDAMHAIEKLMDAPEEKLRIRTSYNLSGISFSPEKIYAEIKKHIPSFRIKYQPDFRQQIAASWPDDLEDSFARQDWGWKPKYDLPMLVEDMLVHVEKKLK